jgi:hypothetical protein
LRFICLDALTCLSGGTGSSGGGGTGDGGGDGEGEDAEGPEEELSAAAGRYLNEQQLSQDVQYLDEIFSIFAQVKKGGGGIRVLG